MRNSLKQKLIESLLMEDLTQDMIRPGIVPPGGGVWIYQGGNWYWVTNDNGILTINPSDGNHPGPGSTVWNADTPQIKPIVWGRAPHRLNYTRGSTPPKTPSRLVYDRGGVYYPRWPDNPIYQNLSPWEQRYIDDTVQALD